MRSGQFVGRLILGNVNHGAPGGQGVVGSIDADLIRSQLLEISSMVRRPWWYQWCLPVHDFLRDVAEGMGMVLKDDTISDPKGPDDLFHLFELLYDGSDRILHDIMQEVFERLLVCYRSLRYPVSQAGQEISVFENVAFGRECIVKCAEPKLLLIEEVELWPQIFGPPLVTRICNGAPRNQFCICFDGEARENGDIANCNVFVTCRESCLFF
ncbi:hypothetical protein FOCG_18353 [Fusarium oxysporum f. sp. radicis-lycopersici 26381]|nr:hypothetical protein FOCG_18353 [Fusarium oxysporum f. sp. radicis-lycopersici 26381]